MAPANMSGPPAPNKLNRRRAEVLGEASAPSSSRSKDFLSSRDSLFGSNLQLLNHNRPGDSSEIWEGIPRITTVAEVEKLIAKFRNGTGTRSCLVETVFAQSTAIVLQLVAKENGFMLNAPNGCQAGNDLRCRHCFHKAAEQYLSSVKLKDEWEFTLQFMVTAAEIEKEDKLQKLVNAANEKKASQSRRTMLIDHPPPQNLRSRITTSAAHKTRHIPVQQRTQKPLAGDGPQSLAEKRSAVMKKLGRPIETKLTNNCQPVMRAARQTAKQVQKKRFSMIEESRSYEEEARRSSIGGY